MAMGRCDGESRDSRIPCVNGGMDLRGGSVVVEASPNMRTGGQLGSITRENGLCVNLQAPVPEVEGDEQAHVEGCARGGVGCEQAGPSLPMDCSAVRDEPRPRRILSLRLLPSPDREKTELTAERHGRGVSEWTNDAGCSGGASDANESCNDEYNFGPDEPRPKECDCHDNTVFGSASALALCGCGLDGIDNFCMCSRMAIGHSNTNALISLACANLGVPASEYAGMHGIYCTLCCKCFNIGVETQKAFWNNMLYSNSSKMHPTEDMRWIISCGHRYRYLVREGVFDSEYPYIPPTLIPLLIHRLVCMCMITYTHDCIDTCIDTFMHMSACICTVYELHALYNLFGSSAIALERLIC